MVQRETVKAKVKKLPPIHPGEQAKPVFAKCFCQHCNGHIEFDEDYAGLEAACPHCESATELFISREPLPPTTHKSVGYVVVPFFSLVKPMSEKQTAKMVLDMDKWFNSDMKKRYGDSWPEAGITIKEWNGIQENLQREKEGNEAFSKFLYKQQGISPSKIKKADHDPDWSFFFGIGAASNRDLKIEWVKSRIQKALEQNDLEFFIRFGSELKRKPRKNDFDKLSYLLALGWNETVVKNFPPLCGFTDEALLEILKIYTGNKSLTFDQIRKARQRLGLKTKDVEIKGIEIVGDSFRLIGVDKAEK